MIQLVDRHAGLAFGDTMAAAAVNGDAAPSEQQNPSNAITEGTYGRFNVEYRC